VIDARQTKILLVDDDRHIRIVVKDFLSAKGYEVLTARNGPEALDMLTTVKPDLVLLDIMMPGMDGGDVARIIRSDPDYIIVAIELNMKEYVNMISVF